MVNYIDLEDLIKNRITLTQEVNNFKSISLFENKKIDDLHIKRINLLSNEIQGILELENMIFDIIDNRKFNSTKRVKRNAPFSFVGAMTRSLFGTLTYDDYIALEKLIQNNENHIVDIGKTLQNQTVIIQNTLMKLGNFSRYYQNYVNETQTKFLKISEILKLHRNNTRDIESDQKVSKSINLLQLTIDVLYREYELLLNAILFGKRGLLHPRILTLRQVNQFLQDNLNSGTKGSLPHYRSFDELTQILDIKIAYTNKKLVYIMNMPYINDKQHSTYYAEPIITKINSLYTYIKPTSKYYIVNKEKTHFTTLSETILNKCKRLELELLCEDNFMFYQINTNSPCEIRSIIVSDKNNFTNCDVRVANKGTNQWILSNNPYQIIFSLMYDENIKVICNNVMNEHLLSKTGIITLEHNCAVMSENFLYNTPKNPIEANSHTTYFIQSNFNVTEYIMSLGLNNDSIYNDLDKAIEKVETYDPQFDIEAAKLQDVINTIDVLAIKYKNDYSNYLPGWVIPVVSTISFSIATMSIFIFKFCLRKRRR